jgi:hypothetical protein
MANVDSNPFSPGERAATARLLEACVAAIQADRGDPEQAPVLLGQLRHALSYGALAVRQGSRARILDRLAGDLHAETDAPLQTRPHDWQGD